MTFNDGHYTEGHTDVKDEIVMEMRETDRLLRNSLKCINYHQTNFRFVFLVSLIALCTFQSQYFFLSALHWKSCNGLQVGCKMIQLQVKCVHKYEYSLPCFASSQRREVGIPRYPIFWYFAHRLEREFMVVPPSQLVLMGKTKRNWNQRQH